MTARRPLAVLFLGLALPSPAPAANRVVPALPILTSITSVRALSQDEGARGFRVRLRGIVTHFDEATDDGMVIHDGRSRTS